MDLRRVDPKARGKRPGPAAVSVSAGADWCDTHGTAVPRRSRGQRRSHGGGATDQQVPSSQHKRVAGPEADSELHACGWRSDACVLARYRGQAPAQASPADPSKRGPEGARLQTRPEPTPNGASGLTMGLVSHPGSGSSEPRR